MSNQKEEKKSNDAAKSPVIKSPTPTVETQNKVLSNEGDAVVKGSTLNSSNDSQVKVEQKSGKPILMTLGASTNKVAGTSAIKVNLAWGILILPAIFGVVILAKRKISLLRILTIKAG